MASACDSRYQPIRGDPYRVGSAKHKAEEAWPSHAHQSRLGAIGEFSYDVGADPSMFRNGFAEMIAHSPIIVFGGGTDVR
jgi:hypothetical protein